MKALTVHQPWAQLLILGIKHIETRSWAPPEDLIGQRIAIYAGRSHDYQWGEYFFPVGQKWLKAGVILGTARLLDVGYITSSAPSETWVLWWERSIQTRYVPDNLGNYNEGRYLWLLTDPVIAKKPIPARGLQGLWEWEPPEELWTQTANQTGPNAE